MEKQAGQRVCACVAAWCDPPGEFLAWLDLSAAFPASEARAHTHARRCHAGICSKQRSLAWWGDMPRSNSHVRHAATALQVCLQVRRCHVLRWSTQHLVSHHTIYSLPYPHFSFVLLRCTDQRVPTAPTSPTLPPFCLDALINVSHHSTPSPPPPQMPDVQKPDRLLPDRHPGR